LAGKKAIPAALFPRLPQMRKYFLHFLQGLVLEAVTQKNSQIAPPLPDHSKKEDVGAIWVGQWQAECSIVGRKCLFWQAVVSANRSS
jgi:hypothetical protein